MVHGSRAEFIHLTVGGLGRSEGGGKSVSEMVTWESRKQNVMPRELLQYINASLSHNKPNQQPQCSIRAYRRKVETGTTVMRRETECWRLRAIWSYLRFVLFYPCTYATDQWPVVTGHNHSQCAGLHNALCVGNSPCLTTVCCALSWPTATRVSITQGYLRLPPTNTPSLLYNNEEISCRQSEDRTVFKINKI